MKFSKLLRIFIVFLVIFSWIFSGWPRIWQGPPIPPEIKEVKADPESMILLWDGAGTPTGWTCISCLSTDDFYGVFPRGEGTYGVATSGAATHNHTASFVSCSNSSGNGYDDSPPEMSIPAAVHTHASADLAPVAASNDPLYRDLKLIQYPGVPSEIPNGAIAIFDTTSLPADWFVYSAQDNYFLRGYSTAEGTGGSNTHTHDITITNMSPASATTTAEDFGGKNVETATHDHDGTGTSLPADHRPPFLEVVFAFASTTAATTSLPDGLIAMFDATPGAGWDVVSDSGDDFYQRFIVGDSTGYGATAGNATHTHDSTFYTPDSSDIYADGDDAPAKGGSTIGHTHTITATFSVADNLPVYRDVIFAKYTAVVEPTISCSTALATTSFGTLSVGSVTTASPNTTTTFSCSDTDSGCALYVRDTGNGVNPGLATSSPAYLIPSPNTAFDATTTLTSEGYGIQATSTYPFDGFAIHPRYRHMVIFFYVGGLSLTNQMLASTTGDTSANPEVEVYYRAYITATTQAGEYEDIITYECTVN